MKGEFHSTTRFLIAVFSIALMVVGASGFFSIKTLLLLSTSTQSPAMAYVYLGVTVVIHCILFFGVSFAIYQLLKNK